MTPEGRLKCPSLPHLLTKVPMSVNFRTRLLAVPATRADFGGPSADFGTLVRKCDRHCIAPTARADGAGIARSVLTSVGNERRMTIAKRAHLILALAALTALAGSAVTLTSGPAPAAGHEDDDVSLYVSSGNTDSVLAYDGETGALQRKFARRGGLTEPEGIAFGPDGNLYVSSRSDEVLRYDGEKGKFIDVFASGHGLLDPAGIAFGGPDDDLFVSSGLTDDGQGNQILRFDGTTGAFEAVVDPANTAGLDDPEAMAFGSDGLLYVASTPEAGPGEVLRYDPADNSFVDEFVSAASSEILDPPGLVFGPDGDLFLSRAATSEVKRYDGTTGALKGIFITAGLGGLHEAEGMAFGPNGNLFVASELGNAVLEYDGTTGAFVGEFVAADSGGLSEPTFITFGPSARKKSRKD